MQAQMLLGTGGWTPPAKVKYCCAEMVHPLLLPERFCVSCNLGYFLLDVIVHLFSFPPWEFAGQGQPCCSVTLALGSQGWHMEGHFHVGSWAEAPHDLPGPYPVAPPGHVALGLNSPGRSEPHLLLLVAQLGIWIECCAAQ